MEEMEMKHLKVCENCSNLFKEEDKFKCKLTGAEVGLLTNCCNFNNKYE